MSSEAMDIASADQSKEDVFAEARVPRLTAERLREMKVGHYGWIMAGSAPHYWCYTCSAPWPCNKARQIARIEELEEGLQVILDAHLESSPGSGNCRLCGVNESWPCQTVRVAKGLLGDQ